jgi:hypothetical protein
MRVSAAAFEPETFQRLRADGTICGLIEQAVEPSHRPRQLQRMPQSMDDLDASGIVRIRKHTR